jgi:hypothetical protein
LAYARIKTLSYRPNTEIIEFRASWRAMSTSILGDVFSCRHVGLPKALGTTRAVVMVSIA